ncbi:MAG: hypothetical protein C4294_01635 [Nitrospiraceae bacterium]
MGVEKLKCVQADIDLIRKYRRLLDLCFPSLKDVDSFFALGQTVLLFRLDPNPIIHRNHAFFQQQILHRAALDGGA